MAIFNSYVNVYQRVTNHHFSFSICTAQGCHIRHDEVRGFGPAATYFGTVADFFLPRATRETQLYILDHVKNTLVPSLYMDWLVNTSIAFKPVRTTPDIDTSTDAFCMAHIFLVANHS